MPCVAEMVNGEGVMVTGELGVIPVPLSEIPCGLSNALSLICKVAWRNPVAEGVNVALMVQVALAARAAPVQVPVAAKSAAFAPVTATVVIFSGAVPELVTVRTTGELVTFWVVSGNEIGPEGVMVTAEDGTSADRVQLRILWVAVSPPVPPVNPA